VYKEESPRWVVLDLGGSGIRTIVRGRKPSRTKRAASKAGVESSTAAANSAAIAWDRDQRILSGNEEIQSPFTGESRERNPKGKGQLDLNPISYCFEGRYRKHEGTLAVRR
jgi:hypothetical protein